MNPSTRTFFSCSVHGCKNSTLNSLHLAKFPRTNKKLRKEWEIRMGNSFLWRSSVLSRVCEVHFHKEDKILDEFGKCKTIKPNSLPSIFFDLNVPKPKSKKLVSSNEGEFVLCTETLESRLTMDEDFDADLEVKKSLPSMATHDVSHTNEENDEDAESMECEEVNAPLNSEVQTLQNVSTLGDLDKMREKTTKKRKFKNCYRKTKIEESNSGFNTNHVSRFRSCKNSMDYYPSDEEEELVSGNFPETFPTTSARKAVPRNTLEKSSNLERRNLRIDLVSSNEAQLILPENTPTILSDDILSFDHESKATTFDESSENSVIAAEVSRNSEKFPRTDSRNESNNLEYNEETINDQSIKRIDNETAIVVALGLDSFVLSEEFATEIFGNVRCGEEEKTNNLLGEEGLVQPRPSKENRRKQVFKVRSFERKSCGKGKKEFSGQHQKSGVSCLEKSTSTEDDNVISECTAHLGNDVSEHTPPYVMEDTYENTMHLNTTHLNACENTACIKEESLDSIEVTPDVSYFLRDKDDVEASDDASEFLSEAEARPKKNRRKQIFQVRSLQCKPCEATIENEKVFSSYCARHEECQVCLKILPNEEDLEAHLEQEHMPTLALVRLSEEEIMSWHRTDTTAAGSEEINEETLVTSETDAIAD